MCLEKEKKGREGRGGEERRGGEARQWKSQCGVLEAGTCLVCSRNNKDTSVAWQEWSHGGCVWEREDQRHNKAEGKLCKAL